MYQPNQQYQQMQNQPQMVQSSGFIPVPNEAYARNYPVAPGNSVTFKDENAPYCYTKTMGFSQLEQPRFEKYRLVKEEPEKQADTTAEVYAMIDELRGRIEKIEKATARKKKTEEENDV